MSFILLTATVREGSHILPLLPPKYITNQKLCTHASFLFFLAVNCIAKREKTPVVKVHNVLLIDPISLDVLLPSVQKSLNAETLK